MSPRTRFVAGTLSVLLVLSALGVYFYMRLGTPGFAPEGKLMLSLAEKGSSEVNLYEYDLGKKTLERIGRDGNSNFDAALSPDGKRVAHIAYGPRALASQVVIYDPATSERRPITRGEAFRHSPDWAPVGSGLAYSEEAAGGSDVYVANLPDAPRRIGSGSYPIWSLDGKSIFALASTGLVRYDLAAGTSATIWGAKGSGMKLSSSGDHSLLAWLIPTKGQLMLFKANPVDSKELLLNDTLSVRAYDAAFSADNKYIALRVLTGEGSAARFEIVIEKLDSGDRKSVLDLSPYEARSLYLSGWK